MEPYWYYNNWWGSPSAQVYYPALINPYPHEQVLEFARNMKQRRRKKK